MWRDKGKRHCPEVAHMRDFFNIRKPYYVHGKCANASNTCFDASAAVICRGRGIFLKLKVIRTHLIPPGVGPELAEKHLSGCFLFFFYWQDVRVLGWCLWAFFTYYTLLYYSYRRNKVITRPQRWFGSFLDSRGMSLKPKPPSHPQNMVAATEFA